MLFFMINPFFIRRSLVRSIEESVGRIGFGVIGERGPLSVDGFTQKDEFALGARVANKHAGVFISTIVVRGDLAAEPPVIESIAYTQAFAGAEYHDIPEKSPGAFPLSSLYRATRDLRRIVEARDS